MNENALFFRKLKHNKDTYTAYCTTRHLPLFYQPWYLDAVCAEGSWDVVIDKTQNEIRGLWPYYIKRKWGQSYLTLPPLTPYLGPWVVPPVASSKQSSRLSYEKKVLSSLFDQLPSHLLMTSQWLPQYHNWLPLYWKGCRQTTRYVYRIDLSLSVELLMSQMADNQRNHVRQAQASNEVIQGKDWEELWPMIEDTFGRQREIVPFQKSLLHRMDEVLANHNARDIHVVKADKTIDAFVYVAYDRDVAYMMMTGRRSQSSSGITAMLVWQAIQEAKYRGCKTFDFQGSMMEGIEQFFRSFGGVMTPYHRITHTPGKWSELLLRAINRI